MNEMTMGISILIKALTCHLGWTCSKSRSRSINKRGGGGWGKKKKREKKGKGKESETCEQRVPKMRPAKILTGGFLSC